MKYKRLGNSDKYFNNLNKYLTSNPNVFVVHNPDGMLLVKDENDYVPTIIDVNENMKILWISVNKEKEKITGFDQEMLHPFEKQAVIFESDPNYILKSLTV
jgi:hypothetical protein